MDAVAIVQEHQALKLYDCRVHAMGGMVQEWDRWRGYEPTESSLIVHGPNPDVDLVNELAQQKRLVGLPWRAVAGGWKWQPCASRCRSRTRSIRAA